MNNIQEAISGCINWLDLHKRSKSPAVLEALYLMKEVLQQLGIADGLESEVSESRFVCHGCGEKLGQYDYEEKLSKGKLRRINVKGEFKTFHNKCFTVFAKHVPEWYIIKKEN